MFPVLSPSWQERARERSLADARQRADEQFTRLLHAAQDMINDGVDVTVPALVARAGMSTKTFYRYFESRDELLLAVLEEELAIGAHLMQKEIEAHDEPVARLEACVRAYVALPRRYRDASVRRSRVRESRRLNALYPDRAGQAHAPMTALFRAAIEGVVSAGVVDVDDVELTARSIFHLLTGHLTAADADADDGPDTYARIGDHAWRFCRQGLQLSAPPEARRRARGR